jgi:hypothetical protein
VVAAAAQATPVTYVNIPIAQTGVGSAGRDVNYVYAVTSDPTITFGALPDPAPGNGVTNAYIISQSGWPVVGGSWNPTVHGAKWIGIVPQYSNGLLSDPSGFYTYQTTFVIPDNVNLSTVLLWGGISSDNCTVAVGINGSMVSATAGGSIMVPGTCMSQGHEFEIGGSVGALQSASNVYLSTAAFHAGINTIQFTVQNNADDSPNPTGLVVWWIEHDAAMGVPEASTFSLLIGGLGVVFWLRRRGLAPRV